MYPISGLANNFLHRRYREWRIKASINGAEYGRDKIVGFEIEQSLVSGQEFEIGTAIVSKLIFRLKTNDEIPSNAKIVPYLALSADGITWRDADFAWVDADFPWAGGETSWIPLGEFYVDRRERVNNVWEYTCYDKLMFANVAYVSQLSYPTTMKAVWDEICNQLGYTYDSSVVINPAYTVPVAPTGYTCRQVMGFIAAANGASVRAGRDGTIQFKQFSAEEMPAFQMTMADYIHVRQTNPVKSYSRVVVVYDTEDNLAYEAGTGDENSTLYVDCPFGTQQIANDILSKINGLAYVPIQMDSRGYPQFDAGDVIQFARLESKTWLDADVSWQDANFPWDGIGQYKTIILHQVMTFRGGLSQKIEAPSKSEQQSEFVVEGTLEQQVNRIAKNAVRFGKTYYGVTHSRDRGIVIDRSDGLASAVFNADELRFTAGGEDALWFDVPNRRWKFSGTLEGVDGIFSGTIQGGSFIGGQIEIGSGNDVFKADLNGIWLGKSDFANAPFRVDMSGHMVATDGQFSGTITTSSIVGGTIDGSVITGALIRTKDSGTRIELSAIGNLLTAYFNDSNYNVINPAYGGGPSYLFYRGGGLIGSITADGFGLTITSQNQLGLSASGGIYIWGGWSNLFEQGGQSLQTHLNAKANASTAIVNAAFDTSTRNLKFYNVFGAQVASVNIP